MGMWRIDLALSEAFGHPNKIGAIDISCDKHFSVVRTVEYTNNASIINIYKHGCKLARESITYNVSAIKSILKKK